MRWIITIYNDQGGSPRIYFFNGTDDEVNQALITMTKEDKEEDEKNWVDGTINDKGVWHCNDGSYCAYNTFDDYSIDYCAKPLNSIKTYINDMGGTII